LGERSYMLRYNGAHKCCICYYVGLSLHATKTNTIHDVNYMMFTGYVYESIFRNFT